MDIEETGEQGFYFLFSSSIQSLPALVARIRPVPGMSNHTIASSAFQKPLQSLSLPLVSQVNQREQVSQLLTHFSPLILSLGVGLLSH